MLEFLFRLIQISKPLSGLHVLLGIVYLEWLCLVMKSLFCHRLSNSLKWSGCIMKQCHILNQFWPITHFSSDVIMGVSNCTSVCIFVSTLYTSDTVISLTTSSRHSSISCSLVTSSLWVSIGTFCNLTV